MTSCLRALVALLSGPTPGATLFRLMRHAGPFSRSGSAECRVVRAYGIEGSGPTWDDAVRQWVAGARWLETQPRRIEPVQLELLGGEFK